MATVFVEKEKCDHLRLVNTSGAALVAGEFVVLGSIACVADEAVANGAVGSFHVEEGLVLQANEFVTGEATFNTANAKVYWKPSEKKFSSASTATYKEVGQLTEVAVNGVIRFAKRLFALTV